MESPRRSVAIVGAGYVGLITALGLAELGHRVELVETSTTRLDALRAGRPPVNEPGAAEALERHLADGLLTVGDRIGDRPDVVMVCVGTPIGDDGRSDLSQLQGALLGLQSLAASGVPIVIRSTLPPGSTIRAVEWSGAERSHLLLNPEFLRQGTALADFMAPTRIVVGHFPTAEAATIDLVTGLYDGLAAPVLVVDIASAEIIKNGANAFLALRLSFAFEIASLCEEYGGDVDAVLDGISRDPRIGSTYLRPSLGFGGSCLPKELQALAVAGESRGLTMNIAAAASAANADQQRRFAERVRRAVGDLSGRRIAILGLAFKAGTDDIRDSPAINLARTLEAGGADVVAFDPSASANAVSVLPWLRTADSALEATTGADAVVVATEWPEFADLDWAEVRRRVRDPLVIDGRRILDGGKLVDLGFRFEAVGAAPLAERAAGAAG
jgi:UDPglucose 6-dehydrogenase